MVGAAVAVVQAYFSPQTRNQGAGRQWSSMTMRQRLSHTVSRMWEISKKGPFYIMFAKLGMVTAKAAKLKLDGGKCLAT